MSALIVMTGLIVLSIIYFLGKGFLAVLQFAIELLGSLLSSGWFWIMAGFIFLLFLIRILAC